MKKASGVEEVYEECARPLEVFLYESKEKDKVRKRKGMTIAIENMLDKEIRCGDSGKKYEPRKKAKSYFFLDTRAAKLEAVVDKKLALDENLP
eukprot:IDg6687t1